LKKESLYLDTSVPSAYFDNRTPERQEATIEFWNKVLPGYNVYLSEITIEELDNTKDETLRMRLKDLVKNFEILKTNEEINRLARAYVDNNILSEKYIDDARHVAIASFFEITYLLSWNFEHLVKVKTRK
jgi:predicted nucleic acid-binding protein